VGAAVYRAGAGVTAPTLLYKVEPEYSEEARKAKYQGVVVLSVIVDPAGRVTNPRVIRSLGLGLDEKAVDAVRKWKFRPGYKDGRPVAVTAEIEVSFRLL
jgi:TonB family protein